jgi:hypothetical protein
MRISRLIRSGLAVLVAGGPTGLAACSEPASGLDGSIGYCCSAGVATAPGQPADYTGFLANHTGHVVTLKSATLLPLKGFRTPRLVHLAVEPTREFAASETGWPPAGDNLHLVPFAGAHVSRGRRVQILYAVVAGKVGEYGDAGIRVTVVVGSSPATVDVLSAAGTCVKRNPNIDCPNSFYNRIQNAGTG